MCVSCYNKDGHPHKMDKLGFDLDDGTLQPTEKANPQVRPLPRTTPFCGSLFRNKISTFFYSFLQEARKLSIQRCIQSLVHACQCRDANCRLPSCQRMKRVVTHTKACKMKVNGNCPICKQLIALCFYHAKYCQVSLTTKLSQISVFQEFLDHFFKISVKLRISFSRLFQCSVELLRYFREILSYDLQFHKTTSNASKPKYLDNFYKTGHKLF